MMIITISSYRINSKVGLYAPESYIHCLGPRQAIRPNTPRHKIHQNPGNFFDEKRAAKIMREKSRN